MNFSQFHLEERRPIYTKVLTDSGKSNATHLHPYG